MKISLLVLTVVCLLAAAGPRTSISARSAAPGLSPAAPRADAPPVPFKGSFEGRQTVMPGAPGSASVEVYASGTATHLGRFEIELPHTVDFATRSAEGTATLTAADGSTIVADFTGQAQVGPIVSIVEQATITGGTGRFAGASGEFTITRVYDPAAGVTSGEFDGTLVR